MNRIFIIIYILVGVMSIRANDIGSGQLFTTAKSFDLIASLQYFDKIKDNSSFKSLAEDSIFMCYLNHINNNVTASKLCNFYATFNNDRNDIDSCICFFETLSGNTSVGADNSEWINNIIRLQPEITYCLAAIYKAGYSTYWDYEIKPTLESYINSYPVSNEILNDIHETIIEFSSPEVLSGMHSNIYVMNIDNAFNLSDESFCCTPLLLDKEMEKQFRLNFINVYIHENLHKLKISEVLMSKLNELKADDFYRENEAIASNHREGLNEAFVVAAEVFISNKIGIRNMKSVYDEFVDYVEGSLVLAPILFVHLKEKDNTESFNDFILKLFNDGIIKVGSVKSEYEKAIAQIKSNVD